MSYNKIQIINLSLNEIKNSSDTVLGYLPTLESLQELAEQLGNEWTTKTYSAVEEAVNSYFGSYTGDIPYLESKNGFGLTFSYKAAFAAADIICFYNGESRNLYSQSYKHSIMDAPNIYDATNLTATLFYIIGTDNQVLFLTTSTKPTCTTIVTDSCILHDAYANTSALGYVAYVTSLSGMLRLTYLIRPAHVVNNTTDIVSMVEAYGEYYAVDLGFKYCLLTPDSGYKGYFALGDDVYFQVGGSTESATGATYNNYACLAIKAGTIGD